VKGSKGSKGIPGDDGKSGVKGEMGKEGKCDEQVRATRLFINYTTLIITDINSKRYFSFLSMPIVWKHN
jgi:hypothetical protein